MPPLRTLSTLYRLLLPFALAIGLFPLFQVEGNTAPTLSCRLNPAAPNLAEGSTLQLWLSNVNGLKLGEITLTISRDSIDLLDPYQDSPFSSTNFVAQSVTHTEVTPERISLRLEAYEPDTAITVNEGILATAALQPRNTPGLVTFTLTVTSATLRNSDNSNATLTVRPNCYLAIGGAALPTDTPTLTPAPTSPLTSVPPTPTATPTNTPGPPPTATHTPTFTSTPLPTETATPTFTETHTPTPSLTPTVLVVATPTPRDGLAQSPLPTPESAVPAPSPTTPTPFIASTFAENGTPDIAATLTVEAQATLLDFSEEVVLEPLLDTTPFPATATPARTQTPSIELLSPPTLPEESLASEQNDLVVKNEVVATITPSTELPVASTSASTIAMQQEEPALAAQRTLVEVTQPPAGEVLYRRPFYITLSWVTFVGAVVLVFTSWWLRRER